MSKEKIEVGDWVRLTGDGWAEEYTNAPEYVQINRVTSGKQFYITSLEVGDVGDADGLYSKEVNSEFAVEWVPASEVPVEIRFKGVTRVANDIGVAEENITAFKMGTEQLADVYAHDPVDPKHYQFPSGVEVRQISGYLTGFGAQALQYVARATRMDDGNKGDRIEDLRKSIKFIEWEIERLEETK